MNNFEYMKFLKPAFMGIGTGFTWFFGAWDTALSVLVCFMALDYLTGLIRAYFNQSISSNVGWKGIARKAVIFVILIVSVLLDRLLETGNWLFRTLTCYFYIANEGISLLENCVGLGLPIPDQLKNALIQLKEGNKKEV